MISNLAQAGVSVPNGFATTAGAYRRFVTGLTEVTNLVLADLDTDDVIAPDWTGERIRRAIKEVAFPADLKAGIR